ncbi:MAG: MFS transporter [Caldisphaera sp.]|nr:MAG: hypothetical protein C0171_02045 [Caldisphaera sp.]
MDQINKIAIISFIRSFSLAMVNPYIGLALNQYYKIPIYLVGLYYLGLTCVTAFGYIIGGYLSDYFGRKNSMILTASLSSISLLLSLINPIVFILFMYFFSNAYGSANTTAVGDTSNNLKGLVKSFSRVRIGANAGWAIGPAIGGFLYDIYGFNLIIIVGATSSMISLPFMLKLANIKGSRKILIKPNRKFAKFLIPALLTSIVMGQLGLPFVLYFSKMFSVTIVGFMFMINGGLVVLFQDFISKTLSKKDYKKSLLLGMTLYSFAYGSLMIINKIYELALAVIILTTGEMITSPLMNAIANSLAESLHRGKYMGLFGLTNGIGRTLGQSISTELSYSNYLEWGNVSLIAFLAGLLYFLIL